MFLTFTDFGLNGPYLGQMKARLLAETGGDIPVLDLMVDVPAFNVKAAAYLLAANVPYIPKGSIVLSIIDPGVGSKRVALALEVDGVWFLGPDNGLFQILLENSSTRKIYKIRDKGFSLSNSFHGRDLFAPVAARISKADFSALEPIDQNDLVSLHLPRGLKEVIYVDDYGNLMTGLRVGYLQTSDVLEMNGVQINYQRTFSEAHLGVPFWYVNSNGLIEVALREGSAALYFKVDVGASLSVVG